MDRAPVLVVTLALGLAGCGGSDGVDVETTTTVSTTTEVAGDPLSCLEEEGLGDIEQRAVDLWRGYHASPFYQVTVDELSSPAEARQLVRDAVDVYAVSAGSYVVTGPAKPSAGGMIGGSDAAEAEAILESVAACLGG